MHTLRPDRASWLRAEALAAPIARVPTSVYPATSASPSRPIRVTFLTVIPAPYQVELFRAVAGHPHLLPRVFYCAAKSPWHAWNPPPLPDDSTILPGRVIPKLNVFCCWNPSAPQRLREVPADLVVVGDYFTLTSQIVMRDLDRRGVPWVFWGERPGLHRRGLLGRALRRWAQNPIRRGARAIAAIGTSAVDAYRELLGDDRPVVNIPYHCDISRYLTIRRRWEAISSGGMLQESRRVRLLFSGQMIDRKGVDVLLRAFVQLSQRQHAQSPDYELTMLGDGPRRVAFEAMVPAAMKDCVTFRGFVEPAGLPDEFARADLFVLPSRHDGWGVVINEAIAAGLPVITTDCVGAARDLVRENENGCIVPADDAQALANAIDRIAVDPDRLATFGQRSREIAREYTPERGADRWYALCRSVLDGDGRQS